MLGAVSRERPQMSILKDKKNNNIAKYFPNIDGTNLPNHELQINDIGKYSISRPEEAKQISVAIKEYWQLNKAVLHTDDPSILDATAGFGGNVISFAHHFSKVMAIEKNSEHHAMLYNNITAYDLQGRVQIYNANFLNVLKKQDLVLMSADIVFLDPPWNPPGHLWYTKRKSVMLYLDDQIITQIVKDIFAKTKVSMVIVKVPYNFDFKHFWSELQKYSIYFQNISSYYCIFCSKLV